MTTQPEALRLAEMYADRLHDYRIRATDETLHDMMVFRDALDAELRRLSAVNEELLDLMQRAIRRLEIEHAHGGSIMREWITEARAAIAKAGGEA
jgi:hypothetical protein